MSDQAGGGSVGHRDASVAEIAAAWLRHHEWVTQSSRDSGSPDTDAWAAALLDRAMQDDPDRAWLVALEVCAQATDRGQVLALTGRVGDVFLPRWGMRVIERVEELARADRHFGDGLGALAQGGMAAAVKHTQPQIAVPGIQPRWQGLPGPHRRVLGRCGAVRVLRPG